MDQVDSNLVVGINPNYAMRRDGGVATLCEGSRTYEGVPHREGFLSHIHLLTAILFACFDGKKPFCEAVLQAAKRLGIPYEACAETARRYVNNPDRVSNRIGGAWQTVPEYMLVPAARGLTFTTYSPDTFVAETYDFTPPQRLDVPISLNLVLTTKCGTTCKYCYAKRPLPFHVAFGVEAVVDLIEQAREIGVVKIDVNGGEVLLYPHWVEVVKALIAHGYTPLISTKLPIKRDVVARLVDLELPKFQISLDSANPRVLSSLLGVRGESYLELMAETLRLLSEAGVYVQINSLITRENDSVADMDALLGFLAGYTCVRRVAFSPAGYSLYSGSFLDYSTTRSAIGILSSHLDSVVRSRYRQVKFTFSEGDFSPCSSEAKGNFAKRAFCTANTRNAVVLPDGRVTICEELYDHPAFIIGDLKVQSLKDVWNSQRALSLFNLKRADVPFASSCRSCHDFTLCHQGRGVCWKTIIMAYGAKNCFFPDPLCPKAPEPINTYWHE